jgi:hypothetical protein
MQLAPSTKGGATSIRSGHKSVQMVRRYIRDGSLFRENSAGKLGWSARYRSLRCRRSAAKEAESESLAKLNRATLALCPAGVTTSRQNRWYSTRGVPIATNCRSSVTAQ